MARHMQMNESKGLEESTGKPQSVTEASYCLPPNLSLGIGMLSHGKAMWQGRQSRPRAQGPHLPSELRCPLSSKRGRDLAHEQAVTSLTGKRWTEAH